MQSQSAVLVRWAAAIEQEQLALALAASSAATEIFGRVEANRALDGSCTYVYFWLRDARPCPSDTLATLRSSWQAEAGPLPGFEVTRLAPVLDMAGASSGEEARFHYVVETDVDPANAQELADWYAQEHLPGLAAVPGNIRARRLENIDGGPRSFACYDLVEPQVLESAAWLAVRETAWSSRVRPMFRNTRRTMFERLFVCEH